MKYKDAYVKVMYSQPAKKGRKIFGGLVPYGQVWRTGANETTEITTTKDIIVKGNLLLAGTYSIFTIPGEQTWIIIFNKDTGLWGSYNYNDKNDAFRFEVPVESISYISELFTMTFNQKNNFADLEIVWDKTRVIVPIQFIDK
ncbi:MAG: DUF2911 domain-containing protein [Flammeovirgaceae bacterium]|nr:DUF2911 domain-containing protein [Flammeovirgaceae bacterium]